MDSGLRRSTASLGATMVGGTSPPTPCGEGSADTGGDFIPDACDPDPGTTTSTTTTSTTTVTVVSEPKSSTTTTTGCASVPVEPTFTSVRCRLAALATQIGVANDVGAERTKLSKRAYDASEHVDRAASLCRQGSRRRTRHALQPAIQKLAQLGRALALRKARGISPALRDELRGSASSLRDDVRALQKTVHCPEDAPA